MLKAIVFLCAVAVTSAAASEVVLDIDLDEQEHVQIGEPGKVVTGSYSFIDANGIEHSIRYIADEEGYRTFRESSSSPELAAFKLTKHVPQSDYLAKVETLPSQTLKRAFNGVKHVLQPLEGEGAPEKTTAQTLHPNIVYSLIK